MTKVMEDGPRTVYRLHPLFILVMLLSLATGYFMELMTLFGIVCIHESGHVVAAKALGWRVRAVRLLPFGGVAEVEEEGNVAAREELIVALAGPLQNIWMIVAAEGFLMLGVGNADWWHYFILGNQMVLIFNLLPIHPLDGGKVLLAGLSYLVSYHKAIVWCAWLSMVLSILMIMTALIRPLWGGFQFNLLLVGLFLIYSNWYAYRHIPYRFLRFLMSREERAVRFRQRGVMALPIVITGHYRIASVIRLFKREKYHLIYIMDKSGQINRVLSEQQVIRYYLRRPKSGGIISDIYS